MLKTLALAIALASAPALAQAAPPSPETRPPQVAGGKFFDATDTNRDGAISRAEWEAAGRRPEGFTMMDLNKDGKVTREEGRAAMQKVMQMRSMQSGNQAGRN